MIKAELRQWDQALLDLRSESIFTLWLNYKQDILFPKGHTPYKNVKALVAIATM